MNKRLTGLFCLILTLSILCCCVLGACKDDEEQPVYDPLNDLGEATLTIAGSWTDFQALELVAAEFKKKYPKCTIRYEQVQDYYASMKERLTGEDKFDLFFTTNVSSQSPDSTSASSKDLLPYVLNLNNCEGVDLSDTFDGLIDNFKYTDETGTYLNTVPLGGVMRGLYVNKTLLNSLNIAVPTNQAELLDACKKLKDAGYIAFGGNPGNFSQLLLYPWIVNDIVNAADSETAYKAIDNREEGAWDIIDEPYRFLYNLVENYYYDYKTMEEAEIPRFKDDSYEGITRDFLNLGKTEDANGQTIYEKRDDVGAIAFMPQTMALESTISEMKRDYHSEIEYEFIPAPVGVDGGYAYLSPAHGISINKNSDNLAWAKGFLNFLFKSEINVMFADSYTIIPNTKNAFDYIKGKYNVPENHISHVGQATFSYNFYSTVFNSKSALLSLSKANAPKYMKDKTTKELYPVDHYLDMLKNDLKAE